MKMNEIEVRKQLSDNILIRLGDGMVDVELTPDQLNKCIDLALSKLRQRSDAYVEESLVLLTLKRDQKEYQLPDEIISIQKIYRRGYGRTYGSTGMDPFEQAWANIYMAGCLNGVRAGGLVTFELNQDYIKTAGRMFCNNINYKFSASTHTLTIAENPRADDEVVLLHSYVDRPIAELIQDRYAGLWIENWAFAEALEILGRIRSRFTSLPGANGQINQDGDKLLSESKELKKELDEELRKFVPDSCCDNGCIYVG